jgi:hypothetical protein
VKNRFQNSPFKCNLQRYTPFAPFELDAMHAFRNQARGGAVQVECSSTHPGLESAWFQPLNLKCDILVCTIFCFSRILLVPLQRGWDASALRQHALELRGCADELHQHALELVAAPMSVTPMEQQDWGSGAVGSGFGAHAATPGALEGLDAGNSADDAGMRRWQLNQAQHAAAGHQSPRGNFTVDPSERHQSPHGHFMGDPSEQAPMFRAPPTYDETLATNQFQVSKLCDTMECLRRVVSSITEPVPSQMRVVIIHRAQRLLDEICAALPHIPPNEHAPLAAAVVQVQAWVQRQLRERMDEILITKPMTKLTQQVASKPPKGGKDKTIKDRAIKDKAIRDKGITDKGDKGKGAAAGGDDRRRRSGPPSNGAGTSGGAAGTPARISTGAAVQIKDKGAEAAEGEGSARGGSARAAAAAAPSDAAAAAHAVGLCRLNQVDP